jgi:hypothetical protein
LWLKPNNKLAVCFRLHTSKQMALPIGNEEFTVFSFALFLAKKRLEATFF